MVVIVVGVVVGGVVGKDRVGLKGGTLSSATQSFDDLPFESLYAEVYDLFLFLLLFYIETQRNQTSLQTIVTKYKIQNHKTHQNPIQQHHPSQHNPTVMNVATTMKKKKFVNEQPRKTKQNKKKHKKRKKKKDLLISEQEDLSFVVCTQQKENIFCFLCVIFSLCYVVFVLCFVIWWSILFLFI